MKILRACVIAAFFVGLLSSIQRAPAESLLAPVAAMADKTCCKQVAGNAIDNDLESTWNSGVRAPASLTVDLGKVYALARVELLVAQSAKGVTRHQLFVSNDRNSWAYVTTLAGLTGDRQWLSAPVELPGRYLRITTIESPAVVAWREIRVLEIRGELPSYGFWDQGFRIPRIRTNYDSPAKGTGGDPLLIEACPFDDCPTFPSMYKTANAYAQNLESFADRRFWVLLNNNEPSYDNRCNSGPPDASHVHSDPGHGLFGFLPLMDVTARERFYRAHLALNTTFANPCFDGIPYMSIGAHANRGNVDATGNAQFLGALNATPGVPHWVSFKTRLYGYQPMHAAIYRLVVTATWPDARGQEFARMIQLNLFHEGNEDSSLKGPASLLWNWPIAEDTFFPGAEVVYFDAEDVASLCPGQEVHRIVAAERNTDLSFDIDLQPLFECAAKWGAWSNPLPSSANVPITSVDWAVEGQSTTGYLWAAVHDMRMH